MNLQSFDLNLLKVLDALLQDRSTVRAGQRSGLSQPAVSAALGRLRAALDDPLLVRDGQALQPTAFALTLVAPVRQLIEDAGRVLARPAFDPAMATDTFRLAAPDFFTEVLLPGLVARLERDAPHVVLRYSDAIGWGTMSDLREGRLDLLLLPAGLLPPWADAEPPFLAEYCIVARRDHPVLRRHGVTPDAPMSLAVLGDLRHAVFRVSDDQPEPEEGIAAALGVPLKVALRAPSFAAVWRAVAGSDLVGMIPRRLADRVAGPAGLDVYLMPYPVPPAEICLTWHRRNANARGLIWLRGVIGDCLAATART
jgi:DNA-binding transcriptional LysR family regulator